MRSARSRRGSTAAHTSAKTGTGRNAENANGSYPVLGKRRASSRMGAAAPAASHAPARMRPDSA